MSWYLPGVAPGVEDVGQQRLGLGGDPKGVVGVGVGHRAGRAGDRHHRAEAVEEVVGAVGTTDADQGPGGVAGVAGRPAGAHAEEGVGEGGGPGAGPLHLGGPGVGGRQGAAPGPLEARSLVGGVVGQRLARGGAALVAVGVV